MSAPDAAAPRDQIHRVCVDPQSSVDDIHALVSRDVALSIKALNYVNSAANGLSRQIESIREALVYLGRDTIRRVVSLYVLASGETHPEEKLTLALQRAKVCELIAERGGRGHPDACFTLGLFSMLDALMDAPLPELLREMNLTEEMRATLDGRCTSRFRNQLARASAA
ncbi:MAG: HDOD domain-containing protein [Chromatocurvus sp.]